LKEEVLDRTLWRARSWRSYGPVVMQNERCENARRHSRTSWKWICSSHVCLNVWCTHVGSHVDCCIKKWN
jgi:hypothetical protein